jgi:hypothetical protein
VVGVVGYRLVLLWRIGDIPCHLGGLGGCLDLCGVLGGRDEDRCRGLVECIKLSILSAAQGAAQLHCQYPILNE